MKKILLAILFLSCITSVQAQFSIGLRGGVSLAEVRGFSEFSSPKPLVSLALPLKFGLSDRWAIQTEPTFIQKGHYGTFPAVNSIIDFSVKINMVELPILAVYDVFQNEQFDVGLFIGPGIGYAFNATLKDNFTVDSFSFASASYAERVDYVGIVGTDIRFKWDKHHFVFDIRYNYEWTEYAHDESSSFQNEVLGFSIGYIYAFR